MTCDLAPIDAGDTYALALPISALAGGTGCGSVEVVVTSSNGSGLDERASHTVTVIKPAPTPEPGTADKPDNGTTDPEPIARTGGGGSMSGWGMLGLFVVGWGARRRQAVRANRS